MGAVGGGALEGEQQRRRDDGGFDFFFFFPDAVSLSSVFSKFLLSASG